MEAWDASDTAINWDPAAAIPTLVGSLLSLFATTTVIFCWVYLGDNRKRREFRYALILNLTVAEFINTLNNSISGIIVVSNKGHLPAGSACNFNGWVGQFSVQAVDFSILAISVVTLLTIQLKSFIIYASTIKKALICISIWIVPLITSIIALKLNLYQPVSGNWCWIGQEHEELRYSLTHGWRYAILLITFCIYVFVFAYMHKRLRRHHASSFSSSYRSADEPAESEMNLTEIEHELHTNPHRHRRGVSSFSFNRVPGDQSSTLLGSHHLSSPTISVPKREKQSSQPQIRIRHTTTNVDRDVWQMVLLNLYPVTYLILWLPGIANRLAEANGHSIRALRIMQSSTQFIGLANACVYFYKEHRRDMREWWGRVRS